MSIGCAWAGSIESLLHRHLGINLATRIGRTREDSKPRLVRVRTTAAGKKLVMSKRGLKHRTTRLYINHDLTVAEREKRKQLLPTFRSLRQANIQCSLPRDKLLRDGKEMTEADIQASLSA